MIVAHVLNEPGLTVSFSPLAFPSIPFLPLAGILVAAIPAVVAPRPGSPAARRGITTTATDARATRFVGDRRVPSDLSGTPA
jgi:hypothetical protein